MEVSEARALEFLDVSRGTYVVLNVLGDVFRTNDIEHLSDYLGGIGSFVELVFEDLVELGVATFVENSTCLSWLEGEWDSKASAARNNDEETVIQWVPGFLTLGSAVVTRFANLQNFVVSFSTDATPDRPKFDARVETQKSTENVIKNISALLQLYPERKRTRAIVPIRRYETPVERATVSFNQKILIISGGVLGIVMGVFFGCVHSAEAAGKPSDVLDVDEGVDLERDNASQSEQEPARDQTEVSSSVRDQHHMLPIFRQFEAPPRAELCGEFQFLNRGEFIPLSLIDINLDFYYAMQMAVCPELDGRVFNITDAEFVSGRRKVRIVKPRAVLAVKGVRFHKIESVMNH